MDSSNNQSQGQQQQLQPQQYCLRWNNHQHNLLSVFEELLNHEAFVDVTLACDGLQLKAHKMVLSACSPYFQSMLYNTPDRHPIVFLRDVRYHEMKALLEFMYRGEVSIDQENLSSLLKVAEGLKIKGLAEVNDGGNSSGAASSGSNTNHTASPTNSNSRLTPGPPPPPPPPPLLLHPPFVGFPGLMSPPRHSLDSSSVSSSPLGKRNLSSPPPTSSSSSNVPVGNFLGPKRKRGRPRRLSGSEAIPMASGLTENTNHLEDSIAGTKIGKGLRESSGEVSNNDTKPLDSLSEADSIDGRSSGAFRLKKESALKAAPEGVKENHHGTSINEGNTSLPTHSSLYNKTSPPMPLHHSLPPHSDVLTRTPLSPSSMTPLNYSTPPPAHSQTPHSFPLPLLASSRSSRHEEGSNNLDVVSPHSAASSHSLGSNNIDHQDNNSHDQEQSLSLSLTPLSQHEESISSGGGHNNRGMRMRGRRGRGRNRDRSHQRQLSEMSVRGLDLLRYATLSPDGTYRCIECDRVQITKNFKNKYSFQRHAFLYHEGAARKVFPCTVCKKEFSRPDKMKQHLKQAHEGFNKNASKFENERAKMNARNNPLNAPRQSPSPASTNSLNTVSTSTLSPTNSFTTLPSPPIAPMNTLTSSNAAAAVKAAAAAMAAGVSPSAASLLVNPFLDLSDPRRSERKSGSLKDSSGNH